MRVGRCGGSQRATGGDADLNRMEVENALVVGWLVGRQVGLVGWFGGSDSDSDSGRDNGIVLG